MLPAKMRILKPMRYLVHLLRRILGTTMLQETLLQVQQQMASLAQPAAPDAEPPKSATLCHARAQVRLLVARSYLRGQGVEIGAFASPLELPEGARVQYIDKYSAEDIGKPFNISGLTLEDFGTDINSIVIPDIVDSGETLAKVGDYSQDFVIANHVFEHFEDPIKGFKNMLRILRHGGILYLSLPEMRHSFDRTRKPTSFEHLLRDYEHSPTWSRGTAYQEFAEIFASHGMDKGLFPRVHGSELKAFVGQQAQILEKADFSIHFHAWTMDGMQELFLRIKSHFDLSFETKLIVKNEDEVIFIFEKTVPQIKAGVFA